MLVIRNFIVEICFICEAVKSISSSGVICAMWAFFRSDEVLAFDS